MGSPVNTGNFYLQKNSANLVGKSLTIPTMLLKYHTIKEMHTRDIKINYFTVVYLILISIYCYDDHKMHL